MPGINDWSFKLISEKRKPFHNSMDGTRVIRTIELYENEYLVGESFPADIRLPLITFQTLYQENKCKNTS